MIEDKVIVHVKHTKLYVEFSNCNDIMCWNVYNVDGSPSDLMAQFGGTTLEPWEILQVGITIGKFIAKKKELND